MIATLAAPDCDFSSNSFSVSMKIKQEPLEGGLCHFKYDDEDKWVNEDKWVSEYSLLTIVVISRMSNK